MAAVRPRASSRARPPAPASPRKPTSSTDTDQWTIDLHQDAFSQATSASLFLDTHTSNDDPNASVTVCLNPPSPTSCGTPLTYPSYNIDDHMFANSRVLTIPTPTTTLLPGNNVIRVSGLNCGGTSGCTMDVQNVHLELHFPPNYTGTYSGYTLPAQQTPTPVAPLPSFGTNAPPCSNTCITTIPSTNQYGVEVQGDCQYALTPSGKCQPITKLEVDVTQQGSTTIVLSGSVTLSAPTPWTDQTVYIDTTQLTPCVPYTMSVTAYGQDTIGGNPVSLNSDGLNSTNPTLLQTTTQPAYNYRTVQTSNGSC